MALDVEDLLFFSEHLVFVDAFRGAFRDTNVEEMRALGKGLGEVLRDDPSFGEFWNADFLGLFEVDLELNHVSSGDVGVHGEIVTLGSDEVSISTASVTNQA